MAVAGNPISLAQIGQDLDLGAGMNLGRDHARARVANKKTGGLSMSELKGTTTSMCTTHYPTWNVGINSPTVGFKEYMNGRNYVITSPSNDTTKDANLKIDGYISQTDAVCELAQVGYCDRGSYNFYGQMLQDFSTGASVTPFSVAVVVNTTGWLRGSQQIVYNTIDYGRDLKTISANFNVPDGYPYLTLALYQFVYLHPNHGGSANYHYPYQTTFTNCRVRKL